MGRIGKWTNRKSTLGTVDVPVEQTWYLQTPYAQQIFSLVPASAGVVCGLLFSQRLASNNATHVKASEVLWASGLSFAASLAVVFMIKSFKTADMTELSVEEREARVPGDEIE